MCARREGVRHGWGPPVTETDERSPSALDLWLMRHSTLVLLVGLGFGVVGVVAAGTARAHGEDAGSLKWVFYLPCFLLVGMAARAKSMSKRSRT